MPLLNTQQLMERVQKRIHQLELGEEIAAKDIKALLNAEQQQKLVTHPLAVARAGHEAAGFVKS